MNRNLSVKILLQAAKEHAHRQFIFISPHDLGYVDLTIPSHINMNANDVIVVLLKPASALKLLRCDRQNEVLVNEPLTRLLVEAVLIVVMINQSMYYL